MWEVPDLQQTVHPSDAAPALASSAFPHGGSQGYEAYFLNSGACSCVCSFLKDLYAKTFFSEAYKFNDLFTSYFTFISHQPQFWTLLLYSLTTPTTMLTIFEIFHLITACLTILYWSRFFWKDIQASRATNSHKASPQSQINQHLNVSNEERQNFTTRLILTESLAEKINLRLASIDKTIDSINRCLKATDKAVEKFDNHISEGIQNLKVANTKMESRLTSIETKLVSFESSSWWWIAKQKQSWCIWEEQLDCHRNTWATEVLPVRL